MKSIIIASNCSGGGKTTFTLGLMRLLKDKGYDIAPYKIGPDYIDPAFHEKVTGNPSRNLDYFLQGEEGLKAVYSRGRGEIGIIEGVMGIYDGMGCTSEASTAHVSQLLDIPVILVLTPRASSVTFVSEVSGILEFSGIDFAGIILNNITESYYSLLKTIFDKKIDVPLLGYVPKDERISLKSRHLGLVQSSEVDDLDEKISTIAELIEDNVDVDRLLNCLVETERFNDNFHLRKRGLKIGIARDKAFSFYYKENIELLEEIGEIKYFSPLEDEKLPDKLDFIYIGGGYPEVFREELSKNTSFIQSLKDKLEDGLPCYAECGGLMYLMEEIEGEKMVGVFKGESVMTDKLNNFGYTFIDVKENSLIRRALKVRAHEFHKSTINSDEEKVYTLEKRAYDGSLKSWKCGYIKKNTLGAYAHIHFFSNIEFLKEIINSCKEKSRGVH